MDSRMSFDEEVLTLWKERKACIHSNDDVLVDVRVVQIAPLTFEIYHTKKCSRGCYYEVFFKKHTISNEAIMDMYK